jgi:hypothetical protein
MISAVSSPAIRDICISSTNAASLESSSLMLEAAFNSLIIFSIYLALAAVVPILICLAVKFLTLQIPY